YMKGQKDSSIWAYKQSLALDSNDMGSTLLVAKAIVDAAVYDTAQAGKLKADTAAAHRFRNAFADRVDSAKSYVDHALTSSDSTVRFNAALIMLQAGSKIAQVGAYDRFARPKDALVLGASISPGFVNTTLQNLGKFEAIMPQVKKQFKCRNF